MQPPIRCAPELLKKDLSGKTYIVTGANSGVGLATTQQLAKQGAHVVAACRRTEAGTQALAGSDGSFEVAALDLGSLNSVREFASSFLDKHTRLDGLVNNAGVMHCPEGKTEDGFETQFGVCHLGHFLLTELLLDVLKSSAPSRIVNVSSVLHVGTAKQVGEIDFDDLDFSKRGYDKELAYTQAKLANVLHAKELTTFSGLLGIMSAEDGAQTSLHCLLDDKVPEHAGEYYSQTSMLYPEKADRGGGWPMKSPNPNVRDAVQAERLYECSLELTGQG